MKKNIFNAIKYRLLLNWKVISKMGIAVVCPFFCFQEVATARQTGNATDGSNTISLEIPGLPSDPREIVWDRLPQLKGERITVFEGEENVSSFCHHATIFYYKDRFFATWSNGDKDEDYSMQRVLYATSKDGYKWSKPTSLTGSIPERAYTPCGYWVREGNLFALASLSDSRASALTSNDNRKLLAYRWNPSASAFEYYGVVANGFYAINGPQQAADGEWMMFGKPDPKVAPPDRVTHFARGGTKGLDAWDIKPVPDGDIAHDISAYSLPGGRLLAVEAKGRVPNRRLATLYSDDHGKSWSKPERSNFPDADSRLYSMKLSNGRYVLLNNPNLTRYRIPLSIALSADGKKYDRLANIRVEQTNKRYPGHAKAPGYQYMRALEHDGKLWIIYSVNKEDVEITVVTLDEIERFYSTDQKYDNRKPSVEIIVDNNQKGFTTNSAWPTDTTAGIYDGVWTGYHGSDYSYMKKTDTPGSGWAKWAPEITQPGVYSIYMKWATIDFGTRSPMAEVAPIEIKYPGGIRQSSVDQTRYGGSWVFLGSFLLKPGEESYVKIYAGTKGTTVADAVKFVKID